MSITYEMHLIGKWEVGASMLRKELINIGTETIDLVQQYTCLVILVDLKFNLCEDDRLFKSCFIVAYSKILD